MVKFKLYFDKDAETKWLNEMAEKGYAMTKFFAGFYTFEQCVPGEYTYQVDFGNKLGAVDENYRAFMEEADIDIVQVWGYWIILRKKTADGPFILYSDVDSSIEHYKKILLMFKIVTIFEMLLLFVEIGVGAISGFPVSSLCFIMILTAIVIVLARATFQTKHTINQLNERKTGIPAEANKNVSLVLASGMLLNACALMIGDSVSYYIKLTVQLLAIVLMLVGIYQTAKNLKKGNENN